MKIAIGKYTIFNAIDKQFSTPKTTILEMAVLNIGNIIFCIENTSIKCGIALYFARVVSFDVHIYHLIHYDSLADLQPEKNLNADMLQEFTYIKA